MKKLKLLLVTGDYSDGSSVGNTSFVEPELPHLNEHFDITIAPYIIKGNPMRGDGKFTMDTSLSEYISRSNNKATRLKNLSNAALSRYFLRESLGCLKAKNIPNLKELVGYSRMAISTIRWVDDKVRDKRDFDLIYTYWSNGVTSGLLESCSQTPIVTRVHGYDLLHERWASGYNPGFYYNMNNVERVFAISAHGQDYLEKHGVPSEKIILSRYGINNQRMCSQSTDGIFRVVSCSSIIDLKRVDKIYEALCKVAIHRKDYKIKWTHLGGGDGMNNVTSAVESNCPNNLSVHLPGNLPHSEVLSYYKTQPIDLFVHASAYEGLPFAIQEATSFGVPVVSTDVGGISEIVVPNVGFLVDPKDPAQGLADAIMKFLNLDSDKKWEMRKYAHQYQRRHFNADKNHSSFAYKLYDIANSKQYK